MFLTNSTVAQGLLNYFFSNQDEERYVNELAHILGVDPKNLDRQLKKFVELGLLKSEFKGKQRYYSLNQTFPLLSEYRQIFKKTMGVEKLLKTALQKISQIEEAYIFGSYAKDNTDASSDIDVLIIGEHDIFEAQKAVLPLQNQISREINIIDMTKEEFETRKSKKDPFLIDIFSKPIIQIV